MRPGYSEDEKALQRFEPVFVPIEGTKVATAEDSVTPITFSSSGTGGLPDFLPRFEDQEGTVLSDE